MNQLTGTRTTLSNSKTGIFYGSAAYMLWGLLPVYWKFLQGISAHEILAHRIIWSFAFVMLLLIVKRQNWSMLAGVLRDRKKLLGLLLSSLLITSNWYLYIWTVNSNRVVEASLGYYFNPLLIVLLGIVVLKERVDLWQIISLGLAAIGVIVLTLNYGQVPWISLGLALGFGLYGLTKRLVQVDSSLGLALETIVVMPFALVYLWTLPANDVGFIGHYGTSTLLLLMGGGIATATPLLLFAYAVKSVPFTTIGFLQYLSPSLSLILGIFVYHEEFSVAHAWSFGFIWLALAVYSLSRLSLARRSRLNNARISS